MDGTIADQSSPLSGSGPAIWLGHGRESGGRGVVVALACQLAEPAPVGLRRDAPALGEVTRSISGVSPQSVAICSIPWSVRSSRSCATRDRLPGRRGRLSAWAAVGWFGWCIRVADRTIPPFLMASARYLIAGAVLYPVARLGGRRRRQAPASPPLAQWAGMAVVGTMLLAFGNGGVSYAERTLPSGLAALLVASVPFWMVLADRVINSHRIRSGGWLALVIGLAGVAVLAQPRGHGALLPVLVVLVASMSWDIGSVLAGRMPAPASPLLGSAMQMLAGGAVLTGLASATGELTQVRPWPRQRAVTARAGVPDRPRVATRPDLLRDRTTAVAGLRGLYLRLRQPRRGRVARHTDPR